MENAKIPVTILTGFLGAGKTSLLNSILASAPNEKIAVIENEFGSVGVDGMLVGKIMDQSVFELSNGCICCNLSGPLQDTLKSIVRENGTYSRVIIETTGVADPSGVIKPFLSDPFIRTHFQIDAVICVADSQIVASLLSENKEALMQVSFSDVVVVNKTDTVSANALPAVRDAVLMVNPFAKIYYASNGIVDHSLIGLGLYSERSTGHFALNFAAVAPGQHLYTSECIELEGYFDMLQFKAWLMTYSFFNQKQVFRIKGFVWMHSAESPSLVQVVRDSVAITVMENGIDIRPGLCRLVFIGSRLNTKDIIESLQSLIETK